MLSRKWIENLDASGRIYRKANEQYLPAYQAFWLLARDVSTGVLLFVFGFVNAALVLLAGYLLGISSFLWLAALAFAALALAASGFDAYSLVFLITNFGRGLHTARPDGLVLRICASIAFCEKSANRCRMEL